jgi:hypothetical protein
LRIACSHPVSSFPEINAATANANGTLMLV